VAFKLAEAYVQFSQRGLSGVQSMISGVGSGFGGAMGMAGKFAAGLGAIGIGVSAGGMLKLAADAEAAEVKFKVLLKSGDAAKQMVKDIDKAAASTPFEKMEISQATQTFMAMTGAGAASLDQVMKLGDIAALTGTPLVELSETYAKMVSSGRVMTEDLNQLSGRGIPIIKQLAAQFGVSEAAVRDMASEGKISAADLDAAFTAMTSAGGDFEGGMAQLSQTTAGRFSTLKDNVTAQLTMIGTAMLPIANDLMSGVSTAIETHQQSITDSLSWVSDNVGFVWNNVGDIFTIASGDIAVVMYNLVESIKTTGVNVVEIGTWMAENWQTILQDMSNLTGTMLTNIGTNLSAFLAAVKSWLAGDGFNFEFTDLTEGFERQSPELKLTAGEYIESTPERDAALANIAAREQKRLDDAAAKQAESQKEASKDGLAEVVASNDAKQKEQDKAAQKSAEAAKLQTGTMDAIWSAARDSIWSAFTAKPEEPLMGPINEDAAPALRAQGPTAAASRSSLPAGIDNQMQAIAEHSARQTTFQGRLVEISELMLTALKTPGNSKVAVLG
jgi:tape measure domain-containing protein